MCVFQKPRRETVVKYTKLKKYQLKTDLKPLKDKQTNKLQLATLMH